MRAILPKASARTSGMTLVELMVAIAIGTLVTAAVVGLFISSLANFAGLGNYAELTGQSRLSLDRLSREIREATQVVSWNTTGHTKSLTVANAFAGTTTTYTWDSTTRVLSCEKTGEPTRTCLTGCDAWDVTFYQRTPANNWTFYPTTDLVRCKLINMSWKCSRTILGRKSNTENVVTAEIVLRNKP
jgi:prepilin-type N-terminal cleavage/methylation domain-containing protein